MVLVIDFGGQEFYDEEKNLFYKVDQDFVPFEYTLKAIFEWEGIHKISWFNLTSRSETTMEHIASMMQLCCLGVWNDEIVTQENLNKFIDYISTPQTATTIQNDRKSAGRDTFTTSEQIYFIMVANRIPIELENWNYHRLNALIAIINDSRSTKKKRPLNDIYAEQNRLNELRLKGKRG